MAIEFMHDLLESQAVIEGGYSNTAKIITGRVHIPVGTEEFSKIRFFQLPSNAIIRPGSIIMHDILSSSTGVGIDSCKLGVGVFPVHNNLSLSSEYDNHKADTLHDLSINLHESRVHDLVDDPDKFGKPLWSLVQGETSDEGGSLYITADFDNLSTDIAGDIVATVIYTMP